MANDVFFPGLKNYKNKQANKQKNLIFLAHALFTVPAFAGSD